MNNPLVSIIVPVYNSMPYLPRCLNSIINQTYKSIELIIVDDGSTDESAGICDSIASKDSRVTVIHKSNTGLSDARNKGVNIAKGGLISFIDADDWIDNDMCELLVDNHIKTGADIVVCGNYVENDLSFDDDSQKTLFDERVLTGIETIDLLAKNPILNSAWNKIYNKKIFQNHKFPIGRLCEDTYFTFKVLLEARKVSFIKDCKYHYLKHGGSLMQSKYLKFHFDWFSSYLIRYKRLAENKEILPETKKSFFLNVSQKALEILFSYPLQTNHFQHKILFRFFSRYKKENVRYALYSVSLVKKIFILLNSVSPHIAFLFFNKINLLFYRLFKSEIRRIPPLLSSIKHHKQRRFTKPLCFYNRSEKKETLCVVLAGYKPFLWKTVFSRLKKFSPLYMDICIASSGLFSGELLSLAKENNWSYISTRRNSITQTINTVINHFPRAQNIYKMDEDIFLTKNVFVNLFNCYEQCKSGEYLPLFAAPLIPVNGYGYVRVLKKLSLAGLYTKLFEPPRYTSGRNSQIEDNPETAKFFWGAGGHIPHIDLLNSGFNREELSFSVCPIRFSIGMIFFKRYTLEKMGYFTVDDTSSLGKDEIELCSAAMNYGRAIIICENSLVGHLSFNKQNSAMREYFFAHPGAFEIIDV